MAEYLITWLRTGIHDTRTLLMEITPRTPSQEIAHGIYIRRLNELELDGNTDPLDTETVYRDDTDATEFEDFIGFEAFTEAIFRDDTNAIEFKDFKDFKALILNIEHMTSAVYMESTHTQEELFAQTMFGSTRPHPETSLEDKFGHIEALLRRMEIKVEEARQREYAERIKRPISEAKTNLLEFEARHGDDIETYKLDALRASLDYALFNNNMIYMSPHIKKLDIFTYALEDLRNRISVKLSITEGLLTELTSPIQIQNLPQELAYEGYIKKSRELTQEANLDILDIEANYRKDILSAELEDFKTSLHCIERDPQSKMTCAYGKPPSPGAQLEPTRSVKLPRRPITPPQPRTQSLNKMETTREMRLLRHKITPATRTTPIQAAILLG